MFIQNLIMGKQIIDISHPPPPPLPLPTKFIEFVGVSFNHLMCVCLCVCLCVCVGWGEGVREALSFQKLVILVVKFFMAPYNPQLPTAQFEPY